LDSPAIEHIRFPSDRLQNQVFSDKTQGIYRLVTFVALGETYFIATNRFDLKTYEVIMLYAYRWQVELFFRCLKRSFNALHLWSHDPNGIEVHFHSYLIAYLTAVRLIIL
jgi:IS4 transposase